MMINQTMPETEYSDAVLVAASRDGNRDAFRQIVERYQTLVCSIAYSATGSLSRSEDVAQETFLAAWTRLATLREPEKLRGWLCAIVRNCLHRDHREEAREPVRCAVALEQTPETPAQESIPSDQAVSREEEAILWRSLERIPALYREPLILFYREHHSVEQVATALELSEDAVKQRLSRGRKLLQEEVQAFVENTLRRTTPNRAFSAAVLTLLPAAGPVAATAGVGLGAKGSAIAKSGIAGGLLAPLVPFLGIAAGVAAHWLVIRDGTADPALRRKRIIQVILTWTVYLGLAVGGEWAIHGIVRYCGGSDRVNFAALAVFWWFVIAGTFAVQLALIRRLLDQRKERELATPGLVAVAQPVRPLTLAAVAIGAHLAMFSWLIVLAWRCADATGATITAGVMLVLGMAAYVRGRGQTGATLARRAGIHTGAIGIAILLILNVRTNIWVAASYGVSVADASHVLPTWIVLVLSLALVVWVALVFAVVRPGRSLPWR